MKRIFILLLSIFILFCTASCNSSSEISKNNGNSSSSNTSTLPIPSDEQEFLQIVQEGKAFVDFVKSRTQPPNARDESMDNAVAAFEKFMALDTLRVTGVAVEPQLPEVYSCVVSGTDEHNYSRSVTIYFNKTQPMTWYCPFVYYNEYSSAAMDTYLKFLKDDDAAGLANWLFSEGGGAPDKTTIQSASNTVKHLRAHYDFSKYSFEPKDVLESGYVYEVTDAVGNSFDVELHYGDGQCLPSLLNDWELE